MKNVFPASRARQLFEDIAEIKQAFAISNMISEKDAAALLNIEEITLKGYVSRGRISEEFYTVSPINGERFYNKAKIIGFKQEEA